MRKCATLIEAAWLLASLGLAAQDVPYQTGDWDNERFGNHRAVVRVEKPAEAVSASIPWRRRDAEPEKKAVLVFDAATGLRVQNVLAANVTRERGDIVFQPATAPGDYWVYYLPYRQAGRTNYPQSEYLAPEHTADPEWVSRVERKSWPTAKVVAIQAVDEFNSFWPMETIATAAETRAVARAGASAPFLVFPEDRRFSIRMTDDLPQRWVESPRKRFEGEAAPNEFYAFQAGIWAFKQDLNNVSVGFNDLKSGAGEIIPAGAFRCLNTGGTNWDGRPLRKSVAVSKGKIQALWCGVLVPAECPPGLYEGDVSISAEGMPEQSFRLALTVAGGILSDHGDSDPHRMTRLRWLDSDLARDVEVVKPFTPLKVDGRMIQCLGREVTLGENGLPARIRSFFSQENTRLVSQGRDVLAGPMRFVFDTGAEKPAESAAFQSGPVSSRGPGEVGWTFMGGAGHVAISGVGRMEMDGFLEFRVLVDARSEIELKDIRLEIPVLEEAAPYMMGLGKTGGLRPESFEWKWDRTKNQDAVWLGDVNAGFQVGFRAENYSRPLNTNFYLSKPLNMPPSWDNGGRGRVTVKRSGAGTVLLTAGSGALKLEPGKTYEFNFTLLLTPFKLIDTDAQWATRFFHAYRPLDVAAGAGANTLNIHHANEINPYINYPFLRVQRMKDYIDEAHERGMRVKIYNTIRELSNRAPELHALKSLGTEIFSPGPGGGYSWLREHLDGNYIAAWFVPDLEDAAVINSGMSRWHNYYIEGLDWTANNVGIDGLYLDDVAFDRTTMKRIRKVLDGNRPAALIDLHSANQYNSRDGFASSANLYLEHFPYLDRLWFGEYFDYEGMPADEWLVEISGLPFGLMGEMLEGGGNPWRGMVFGMTNRLPWSGRSPEGIWKVWDEFGMAGSEMTGYWVENGPVKTNNPEVLATVYRRKGKALVALASWAKALVFGELQIDWRSLGLDPATARIRAPSISGIQLEATFQPGERIPFEPGKGWILIVE